MPAVQRLGMFQIMRLDSTRVLIFDERHEIQFTRSEYPLIVCLLEGKPVSDQELVSHLFGAQADNDLWAREAVDRHLGRVRRKLKDHRLQLHLIRIPNFGYMLLSR